MFETMLIHLKALARDNKGATAIEYGMIAALIAAVIIGLISTIGGNLQTAFQTIATTLGGG